MLILYIVQIAKYVCNLNTERDWYGGFLHERLRTFKRLCNVNAECSLRFGFLFHYFPHHEALCSHFAAIPEIPQTKRLQFRPKPTRSGLDEEAKLSPIKSVAFFLGHLVEKNPLQR